MKTVALLIDIAFRFFAIVLVLIRLLGYGFFASSLQPAIVIPAFVLLALALVPTKTWANNKMALIFIVTVYVSGYFFGAADGIVNDGMLDKQRVSQEIQETVLIFYFLAKALLAIKR